jgi:lysophospholipase L1-like esterase
MTMGIDRRTHGRVLIGLLVTGLTLAACGGGSSDQTGSAEAEVDEARAARPTPLLEGGERLLFIGDSLAVEAPPNYPELLPSALGNRAPGVETVNLSEPGTTAADWSPGSPLFEERIEPELAEADVVVVSVGGNDLQEALGASDGLDALASGPEAAADAFGAIDRTGRKLRRIFDEIRSRAPRTEVVYVGYPDYSRSSVWRDRGGPLGTAALGLGLSALVDAAADAGPDALIDMRRPTARAGVDSLLADSEHLSAAGHELYARLLAARLTR